MTRPLKNQLRKSFSSLSPRDEAVARVAICDPIEDRLRLGLPVVIGGPKGTVTTIYPDDPRARHYLKTGRFADPGEDD